jgi:hypothetical protein
MSMESYFDDTAARKAIETIPTLTDDNYGEWFWYLNKMLSQSDMTPGKSFSNSTMKASAQHHAG